MSSHPEPTAETPDQSAPKRSTAPTGGPQRKQGKSKKLANGIVALSSAAIIAVYAAGYFHIASAEAGITSVAPTALVASAATTPTATAASLLTPTASTATATTPATVSAPLATATAMTTAATTTTPAATSAPLATATVAATATPTTQPTQAVAASSTYKDGTYTGSGTSKHGGVTVAVVIKNGVIVSTEITASNTRYPISRIAALPGEVVAAQSASINFVSGATDSSMAFQTAVASALALAKGA